MTENKRIKHIKVVKKWQQNNRNRYLKYQKWYNEHIRHNNKLGDLDSEIIYKMKNNEKLANIIHNQVTVIRNYSKNYKHNHNNTLNNDYSNEESATYNQEDVYED
jgi:hypothetical protein